MCRLTQLVFIVLTMFPFGIRAFRGYRGTINIAYYELSPYIYSSENGSVSGIVPEFLEEFEESCLVKFKYSLNLNNSNNFSNRIEDKTLMKQYSKGDWLWLSLTQHVSKETKDSLESLSVNILTSGIDVLVHRDHVGPLATIKVGMFECRYLFLIGLTLSIIFGILIWLIERKKNSEFSMTSGGIFKGIWFGLVTMTTVGYGDIAPKSVFGKLVTMAWMITGVTLTAVLTSTITNVFAGLDHLEMGDKKIVALNRSLEASTRH